MLSIILLLLLFYKSKSKSLNHGKMTETQCLKCLFALINTSALPSHCIFSLSLSRMQWLLLQCHSLPLFFRRMLLLTVSCSLWHSAMEDSSHIPAILPDLQTLPADVESTRQLSMLALVRCLHLKHSRDSKHS